ncbi:MAG: ImmA/IrrE family metallo-endopeptidase [Alphaproteobacteria bacterium]|nr:ImmA/IrrE family metallo-endopeptidase [Alphaproteobacteria bacterium]
MFILTDVPYIPPQKIEREAAHILEQSELTIGRLDGLETPIEEIIEIHLGLSYEPELFSDQDILGYLDIQSNAVRVNENLDPSYNPGQEGRFRFTLAHEVGHNTLHRYLAEEVLAQHSLFATPGGERDVRFCRSSNEKARIEQQADAFAAALLMPAPKMRQAMARYTSATAPDRQRLIHDLRGQGGFMERRFGRGGAYATPDDIFKMFVKDMADLFKVSAQAMGIRIGTLGLIAQTEQREMALT